MPTIAFRTNQQLDEKLRQFALSLGVDSAKVKVIPNGIDPATFYPRDRRACREKYGLHRREFGRDRKSTRLNSSH